MRSESSITEAPLPELLVAVDVGSARVACAVAEIGNGPLRVLAAESATSFGIRGGEIVDLRRASEAIGIAIQSAADRAEAEVQTVVVGLSGDVKLTSARMAMDLDHERRAVTGNDVARLRKSLSPDSAAAAGGPGRRVVHRFDGPCSVGDLQGIDYPEGLSGDRLEMNATFLSAASDRLDNLLKAVRLSGVEVEAVSLEPISCSLGALSSDERALGAAVIDLGGGAFRGALWEGGRLRQIQVIGRENLAALPTAASANRPSSGLPSVCGMEGVVIALARRFRIAPATAERLLRTHAALGDDELLKLPAQVEVAAVDGLGSVRIETHELSRTIEELLIPVTRSLREGLSGFSAGHAVGVVLTGGGAQIKGMQGWMSKRFGGAPVRIGHPRWKPDNERSVPPELMGSSGCSLAGLLSLGAESRMQQRQHRRLGFFARLGDSIKRLTASF